MTKHLFERIRSYYQGVAITLKGDKFKSAAYANTSNVGLLRESAYVKFLQEHVPTKCNVSLGGFVFAMDGAESKQIDVLITADTQPRYSVSGVAFSAVEGTIAIASIKSYLSKSELADALDGIASIPETPPQAKEKMPGITIPDYADWPYKILFAYDGPSKSTLIKNLSEYYEKNPEIPYNRRPNMIHVLNKYIVYRARPGSSLFNKVTQEHESMLDGCFYALHTEPDIQALAWITDTIQRRAAAASFILYSYQELISKVVSFRADGD